MARSLTSRSTNPKIMDDNIKILDNALAAASTPPAEDVVYDNTDSGLTADNVQSAIDEVLSSITTLAIPATKVKDDVDFEFGKYSLTYNSDTFDVVGIKVYLNQERYFILGVVLSGSSHQNQLFMYSSWNTSTYLLN